MYEFYDIEQRSDEWFQERSGCFSGTTKEVLSAESTKGYITLINRLASERVHGKRMEKDQFVSTDMQRGIDDEPRIIEQFTEERFINVTHGGLWRYSDTVVDSPDGNIKDGTIEVKSVLYNVIEKYFLSEKIPSEYKYQCQNHLLCSGTDKGYFIAHNDLYKLFIIEYTVDEEYREKMLIAFKRANSLIEKRMETIKPFIK